jgi:cytoskeleton protein RodZ
LFDMAVEVGQTLREARVARGIELSDVEEETKIRAKYLGAIEEEEWEVLPGEPYNTGFLRSYADFLELDADALVAAHRSRYPPVEEPTPIPETMLPQRGLGDGPSGWSGTGVFVGVAAVVVIAVIGVLALTGGSDDTGERNRGGAGHGGASAGAANTTTTTHSNAHPARVALDLQATEAVWVCLVDDDGHPLIDGETLTPGERRGPFKGRSFEVTFGNGAVKLTVDDRPVPIEDLGEPLGYAVDPTGVEPLGESARPTCL